MKMQFSWLIPLATLFVFCACSSEPKLKGLASDPVGKNQYFDRLNEYVNFGRHEDYYFLLGYNFDDAKNLMMSTSRFDFGNVKANYHKERKFALINPFSQAAEGVTYTVKGSPLFVIAKNTCGKKLTAHRACMVTLKFHPKTHGMGHDVTGLHRAEFVVQLPKHPPLIKRLQGRVMSSGR